MDAISGRIRRAMRAGVPGLGAAEALFWAYCVQFIVTHTNPMGDGMELVALVPMTSS